MIGPHPFHAVGEKYIAAVVQAADCLPLLLPVLETPLDVSEILARVDGIFFPGSPSNVEPHRYAGTASAPGTLHDPHRDATTLSLIPRAVAKGIPVFGVCRGFQEMNVAYGRHAAPARPRGRRPRRSPRGQGTAAGRAIRTCARRGARARIPAAQDRRPGARQRELAALAGGGPARTRPRGRGARARRTGRGVPREAPRRASRSPCSGTRNGRS